MIGKFVTKIIQSLPSWEVTKYYGRVCMYQLKCLKYRVQTSEAWFNFKCKFMPGSLHNELECEESIKQKVKSESKEQKKQQKTTPEKVKSQSKIQYTKDSKSSSTSVKNLKNSCTLNEFIADANKQNKNEDRKSQENKTYSMPEDYMTKKQRKAKQAR
ncbi:uncharacterized protein LOC143427931 isoform X1 [Xylocopa sonorina]|uniref:uncharacterized protein LOC143427931 isoform X1 n=1 Tax=Xylocopa sonorina TaxID=1818115 RepID=UPI00403A9D2A